MFTQAINYFDFPQMYDRMAKKVINIHANKNFFVKIFVGKIKKKIKFVSQVSLNETSCDDNKN